MTPQSSPQEPVTEEEAQRWASPLQTLPNGYKRQTEMWKTRTHRLVADRTRVQEYIGKLEAALRVTSLGYHHKMHSALSDAPWTLCSKNPCVSDRALLAPTEEAQHG